MIESEKPSFFSTLSDLIGYLVTYFFVNLVILLATAVMIPSFVVLGTANTTALLALIQASFLLSFFVVSTVPLIEFDISKVNFQVGDREWFSIFILVNVIFIWILSRIAVVVGMGISSWVVALLLGSIMSLTQGWAVKNLLRG